MQGKTWKYGNNINTDEITPACYLNTSDPVELARHCLEGLDAGFAAKVAPGDLLVAGSNFGCGSSREHAPISIKAVGVSCVIAKTFARIFFRNSINIGLPIVECPQAAESIQAGDVVSVDVNTGTIKNLTRNETYQAQPFPPFMQELISEGGLMNYVKKHFASCL